MKNSIDMLNGPLTRRIIQFALPIVLTSIVQQLFNSADTAIIGRYGEKGALAAVGTNGETVAMLVSLSAGLAIGASVLASGLIGSGETAKIRRAVSTSVIAAMILGAALAVIGTFSAEPLLRLINTPAEILPDACDYLRVYCLAVPFLTVYDFGAAVLRSCGDSKRPLAALIVSGAVNVLLNLVFVIVCKMNVVGVGLATVIATALSAAIVLFWMIREPGDFKLTLRLFDTACFVRIVCVGIPAALQGAVFCFANIFVQSCVNQFGADAVAGSAVAMTFEYFTYYAIISLGQAATTFISQNYAAGNYDRCKKTLGICLVLSFVSCSAMTVPLSVFCRQASSLFTSDPQEIEMSCLRIMLILVFEPICSFYEIPAAAMRGVGWSALPAIETVAGTCLFRIAWVFTVFARFRDLHSLYIVFPITWVVTSAMVGASCFFVFRRISKRRAL